VHSAVWNLIAAELCTIAAAIATVALHHSEPTFVNQLSTVGSAIGFFGGLAWVVAAVIAIKDQM
jgi:hypothetical protein